MLNLERFRNEKIAIHCKNEKEWDKVITQLNAQKLNGRMLKDFDPDFPCIVNGYNQNFKLQGSHVILRSPIKALLYYNWEIVSVDDLMIPINIEEYLKLLDNF